MSKKDLFKQLNALCEKLDNKYCINNGGCCYVAACLAEQLELHNIPFTVIHYDIYGCHYAIKVSDRYLNRCGYRKKEIYEYLDWSSEQLIYHYRHHSWNELYEKKYNGCVKKYIKSIFSKYGNNRT